MLKKTLLIVFCCILLSGCNLVEKNTGQKLSAKIIDHQITVTIDGELFTNYKFADSLKKPYLWPVIGPASKKSVTIEFPNDHPHHNSIFFGCDRVNGGNFWQEGIEKGQIVSQGPSIVKSDGKSVIFTDKCLWAVPGKEPVISDTRKIRITTGKNNSRIIDFQITIQPLTDLRIEKNNHSLFSVRMVPELSVNSGGTIINAQGNKFEKGTWGVKSEWCDYSGTRDGITEGVAIFQHPANRWFPSTWFTRDYGFFSPTPMYWPENGTHMDIAKDESFTLNYCVIVHTGDNDQAGIAQEFADYMQV